MVVKRKLDGIQLLRGLAAIAVVFHHVAGQLLYSTGQEPHLSLFGIGSRGVELFFVISGFIIFFAHGGDRHTGASAWRYVKKRVIRLFPSAFVVASCFALLIIVTHAVGLRPEGISFERWVSSAFIIPMLEQPEPEAIWTLRHEVIFYAIFATFYISRKAFIAAILLWLAVILTSPQDAIGQLAILHSDILHQTFVSDINVIFLFGLVAYFIQDRIPERPRLAGAAFALSAAVFAIMSVEFARSDSLGLYLAYGFVGLVMVLSALQLKFNGWFGRFAGMIGDASYSIYLVHMPVIAVLFPLLRKVGLWNDAIYMIEPVVAVAVGMGFYRLVEVPVMGWMKGAMLNRAPRLEPGNR